MKASAYLKVLMLSAVAVLVAACGGSSGGSNGGFTPAGLIISAAAQSTTVRSGTTTDITVRVTESGGAPVREGTTITASISPASNGTINAIDAAGAVGGATAGTAGGNVNFRFRGQGPGGNAAVTFSVADPNAPGRTFTTVVNISVTAPGPDNRLVLQATTTTLPINAFNVAPFLGSPFLAEVTVTVRSSSGQSVNQPNGIQVSVNPVGNTGGFSTLDDGATSDVNEFLVRLGQGPVNVVAGKATIFMHSLNFSGSTTMTVTTQDPDTGEVVTSTLVFNIVSSISNLPAAIFIGSPLTPIYVQGSGGNTSAQIEIVVNDGIGQPVPNPVAGNTAFNNVRVELLGDAAAGGARVSGVNAQGQNVQGSQISLRTINGVTGALLTSGTQTGSVRIRVTSDRADNNVDNGISDPVTSERTLFISDGVLFEVQITQPVVNALVVNPFDSGVTPTPGATTVPPSPDGTYSVTIAVIATDRLGNPVLPGTPINFGLIDEPQQTGAGDFFIAGSDGNPQENGTLFTAPTGRFTTAGGGAGPGDAVVIISEEDPANRDLEGARVIQTINGPGSLTVTRRFNRNDVTGSTFDAGNALEYVIGRAADGNITANAVTNQFGVARTTMNYAVSRLGKFALIWAQGDGAVVAGQPRTVADAEFVRFAGVAPGSITASPGTIPGNTTTPVTICARDALSVPIEAVNIGFAFSGLTTGSGSVDGRGASGSVQNLTGRNGCTVAQVTTMGLVASGGSVDFFAFGQTVSVAIEVGNLILTANPPSLLGGGGVVTLRLVDASGNPVPGVQLTGACTSQGGANISTSPANGTSGVTNANGEAPFAIFTTNLNQANAFGSGECTYEVPGGTPNTSVPVQGVDLCQTFQSPPAPGCAAAPTFSLAIAVNGLSGTLSSSPAGISCSAPTGSCAASFPQGESVTVLATGPTGSMAPTFSGECGPPTNSVDNRTAATAVMTANRTCSVTFFAP